MKGLILKCRSNALLRIVAIAATLLFSRSVMLPQPGAIRSASDSALCSNRAAIDSYTRILDRRLKTLRQRTFATPFSDEADWHEVQGDYEGVVAHVFFQDDKPVVVGFGFSSESGDWAQDVTYYYRGDGTLAKKHDLLKTFYGHAAVTKIKIYGCSGSVLGNRTEHLDLTTRTAKPPDPEFIDEPSPEYKRVESLPFFHLLPKGRKAAL